MNFKNIHIGQMIQERVSECEIELSRICNFFKCFEHEVEQMYLSKNTNTEDLLKWSKLLDYDFFRIYTQHLILYSPSSASKKTNTKLPKFRKNIYTYEIINFILEMIENKNMTKSEVIKRYGIPKTTLYKWISKYK